MKVAIETHGCKLNQADSQALAREFDAAGFDVVNPAEEFDVYVLNSCTVTHVADRKARRSLRSVRRKNPQATIVATGCYAQRAPSELRRMNEIDIVLGNDSKSEIVRRLIDTLDLSPTPCSDGGDVDVIPLSLNRNRAMVKIQEGCDQVCAYCIVPKVRGREKSLPVDVIVGQIEAYERAGFQEVVLTGTQLGSYGFDLDDETITSLLSKVLERTSIPRVRVSSLQPQDIGDGLVGLWDDSRLCPHFHMPLQSGSDDVLERMRRRYTATQYRQAVDTIRIRIPDVAITADVIVGFPGESDADFEKTMNLCAGVEFADLHVFPYSPRPGTSAAHFEDGVSPEIKSGRSKRLIESAESWARSFRQRSVGQVRAVLWEGRAEGPQASDWTGLTDNYMRVAAVSEVNLGNTITDVQLVSVDGAIVRADPLPA